MSLQQSIKVGLGKRSYPIHIGSGIIDRLPDYLTDIHFPSTLAIITNETVNNLYGDTVLSILEDVGSTVSVIVIEDGEQFKSLATLADIYDELVSHNVDRSCGIIALGGGVVGDIAGFAAATYLRGIPYVQIPTTVLAQVDSSVGGKTAVNHPLGKNLIGAFNQPKLVCIDIDMLDTLPERELAAGMAEIVKYGVIRDREFFAWLKSNTARLLAREPESLIHAIKTSCQIKADIVEIDETESSLRAILNFGHTFGHAVESLTGYQEYLHGEAVAIGMIVAARMSENLGHGNPDATMEIRELVQEFGLPVQHPQYPVHDYAESMMHDKKVKSGQLNMVFNKDIGDSVIEQVDDLEMKLEAALQGLS